MSVAQWAFWLALAALIAACGKFLDDYHIKTPTKTKMRDVLIRWFVWLDAHRVPDLGGVVLKGLRSLFQVRRFVLVALSLAAAYWSTVSAFYLGREIFGPANNRSYVNYLLTWIQLNRSAPYWIVFLAVIIVPALLGLLAMGYLFHRASLTDNDASRLGLLGGGLVFGILLGSLGGVLAFFVYGDGGGYGLEVLFAGMASISVPALLALLTLLLIFVRYAIKLVRLVLLQIFDVASSPTVSPFTYATSLLGVIILAAKVGQAAVTN
jgi:hypothetical protein